MDTILLALKGQNDLICCYWHTQAKIFFMISLNLDLTYTLVIAKFQVSPSEDDELHLDEEIHNTVRKIIRDFVDSWYSTVSTESGFENEVQNAMISMAMELKIRARQVDRKVFV